MLSRHAENLFWIGRYVERAENTARLLDVTYHAVLEAAIERTPADMWAELLETLLLEDEIDTSALGGGDAVGELLLADKTHPGSIPSLVARARENARTTREWTSAEVWEVLNDLHISLGRMNLLDAARNQPYEVLRTVKWTCHTVNGAVEATMPRGEGYLFYVIGVRMERALITTRVLNVWRRRLGDIGSQAAFVEWVKILKSVSAHESYLRAYQASMDGDRVLAFLLQAPDLPRSILNCLSEVSDRLQQLDTGSVGIASQRWAGRIRSRVEFADLALLDIGVFLQEIENEVAGLTHEIESSYFRPTSSVYMHSYEAF